MGNCIVLQHEKVVRVMKTDGKTLEYKTPIKVHQVLSEFSHHAISDKLPAIKYLHPNTEMIQGHLYYLLPLPVTPPSPVKKKAKKSVRFSNDVAKEPGQVTGVVRIKLVITKQELQALLRDGGVVSVSGDVSQLHKEPNVNKVQYFESNCSTTTKGKLPVLESIPEMS